MNIPGYDAWRLRGPDENAGPVYEPCPDCAARLFSSINEDGSLCETCDGNGEVLVELDEPDGDYLYERKRDAAMEDESGPWEK